MRVPRYAFIRTLTALPVVLAAIVLFSLPVVAHAAGGVTSQTVTMSPASTQISVAPGGTVKNSFDVINEGSAVYEVSTSVTPYHVEGVDYDPRFTQLPGTTDASKWVHIIQPSTQQMPAKQLIPYDYTVTVPPGTAPGGYYAVIFAETTPSGPVSNGVLAHD